MLTYGQENQAAVYHVSARAKLKRFSICPGSSAASPSTVLKAGDGRGGFPSPAEKPHLRQEARLWAGRWVTARGQKRHLPLTLSMYVCVTKNKTAQFTEILILPIVFFHG